MGKRKQYYRQNYHTSKFRLAWIGIDYQGSHTTNAATLSIQNLEFILGKSIKYQCREYFYEGSTCTRWFCCHLSIQKGVRYYRRDLEMLWLSLCKNVDGTWREWCDVPHLGAWPSITSRSNSHAMNCYYIIGPQSKIWVEKTKLYILWKYRANQPSNFFYV